MFYSCYAVCITPYRTFVRCNLRLTEFWLGLMNLVPFQVSSLELAGGGSRRTSRRVALNRAQDVGVCWWQGGYDEVWPWSPVPSTSERANLVLLGFSESPGLMVSPHTKAHPFSLAIQLDNQRRWQETRKIHLLHSYVLLHDKFEPLSSSENK